MVLFTNHARAGVPDYEDAVYHHAMTALKWTAAALDALLDAEALVNLMRRRWRESEQNGHLSPTPQGRTGGEQ